MKISFTALLCLVLIGLFSFDAKSQTLSSRFGAVGTDFEIQSDSKPLAVVSQIIVERGVSKKESSIYKDESYGIGIGYKSLHLELILKDSIVEFLIEKKGFFRKKYDQITFLDSEGETLFTLKKDFSNIEIINRLNEQNEYVYLLDLIDVPLVILDKTKTINIAQFREVLHK